MKVIKDLAVTVTYTVELGGVEVPDKVFEQLNNMAEDDAMEWEYEVGIDE